MHRHPATRWIAATLFALAAIAPISSWWLLLFHATSPQLSIAEAVFGQLGSTFSSANPARWWFVGWALMPVFLILIALFYCSPLTRSRRWSVVVAASVFVVTMYSFAFAPALGLFLLVPLCLAAWWTYGA